MFIGYYSLANAVTLFGLISASMSCFLAASGAKNIKFAVLMLFFACICDLFDGRIARSNPNRSEHQQFYGIQLDSLCDMVSFGIAPCFIAFSMGFNGVLDVIIYLIFIVCGAVRLAYFNTLANDAPGKSMKYYRGVPIPVSCFFITLLVLLSTFIPASVNVWIVRLIMLALGICFVLNIKIKKPPLRNMLVIFGIQVVMLVVLFIAGDLKLPV